VPCSANWRCYVEAAGRRPFGPNTACRVARIPGDQIDMASLERLTRGRKATGNQPHGSAES
jgi:hypothetical protein